MLGTVATLLILASTVLLACTLRASDEESRRGLLTATLTVLLGAVVVLGCALAFETESYKARKRLGLDPREARFYTLGGDDDDIEYEELSSGCGCG